MRFTVVANLTVASEVFVAEQLKVKNVAPLLFWTSASVAATKTRVIGKPNAPHTRYFALFAVEGEECGLGVRRARRKPGLQVALSTG